MVQRQLSEAPSVSSGPRESSRMGLGIGYTAYQSGYNKLFTQVRLPFGRGGRRAIQMRNYSLLVGLLWPRQGQAAAHYFILQLNRFWSAINRAMTTSLSALYVVKLKKKKGENRGGWK